MSLRVSDDTLLAIDDGAVVAGDATVAVLDPSKGGSRWTLPSTGFADVRVIGDVLVMTDDSDGPSDTVAAFDIATGAERWRTEVRSVGAARPTPISDDLAVLSPARSGDQETLVVVLDVRDGAIVWQLPGDLASGYQLAGRPYVEIQHGGNYSIHDGETGELLVALGGDNAVAVTGAVYVRHGLGLVTAVTLPGGESSWQLEFRGDEAYFGDVFDGGLMTETDRRADGSTVFTGYVG